MKVKALLFISLLFALSYSCPSSCDCSSKTIICTTCLSQFYQFYNSSSSKCECYEQFAPYIGFENYCCPKICDKCYPQGCASCKKGAVVQWNDTFKYFDCVCTDNYFRSGSKCLCKSQINPQEYYYNPFNNQCFKCPIGCTCNKRGCVSCDQNTNRTIAEVNPNQIVCFCKEQLIDIDGKCSCLDQCTCQDNFIQNCSKQSQRFYNGLIWDCSPPFTVVNNTCKCVQPYIQHLVFGSIRCICKSKLNITGYYQFENQCYQCGDSCICDFKGAISCNNSFWYLRRTSAICIKFATKVNNQCYCLDPYYYSNQTGQCNCLNQKDPIQYWKLSQYDFCSYCPKQCICTQKGCIWCQENSLRLLFYLDGYPKMYCGCVDNARMIDNRCVCQPPYYYDYKSKTCNCSSDVFPNKAYNYLIGSNQFYCRLCPEYCLCDEQGCFFCFEQVPRKITFQEGRYYCDCKGNLKTNHITFACECYYWQQYSPITQQCQCKQNYKSTPYYDEISNTYQPNCTCQSQKDPNKYYKHPVWQDCLVCPDGCRCDSEGCQQCDPLSMRIIVIHPFLGIIQKSCPCVHSAFQVGNVCTICQKRSYYNGEGCSDCLECQSCNHFGCLSCNDGMVLDNYTCICTNHNLTNIDGNCVCQKGQYLNTFVSTDKSAICSDCPVNCQTCVIVNNIVQCTSCDINQTHRENIFQSNCPCQEGYSEAPVKSRYCCPSNCEDCNATHCLSCPLYTFRSLVQGECLCLQPYKQKEDVVCGCSFHSYYLNQSCLQCPSKCKTCVYNQEQAKPVCKICQDGKNRNVSALDCRCFQGFMQTNPQSMHCYAKHCINQQAYCSKCKQKRILNLEGLCICQDGYYESNEVCQKCPIAGCLECQSKTVCSKCDLINNFYLIDSICLEVATSDFILAQIKHEGIVIQIKQNQQLLISSQNALHAQGENIIATLYKLQSMNSSMVIGSFDLKMFYFSQISNVLIVKLEHPLANVESSIISLSFNRQSQYSIKSINIKTGRLLSQDTYQNNKNSMHMYTLGLGLVFILINIVLYVNGYKHNQMVFYMQTLFFLGYYLPNKSIELILLLQNFKVFSFNFALGPLYKVIPNFYYQSSTGNFKWLTGDSNIFRVIGLPILIFIILIPLYFIIKYLYFSVVVNQIKNTVIFKYKKWFYRLFEFLFKSLMYPIIFFSINTFLNFNCTVYFNSAFKNICFATSIMFMCFFLIFIWYLSLYDQMSKLHSIELITQFSINCLTTLLLITTLNHPIICLVGLILIIVIKDITFLLLYKVLVKQKDLVIYFSLAVILLKCVPLIMIYFDLYSYTIWSVLAALIVINVMQLVVIRRKSMRDHYDKLKLMMSASKEYSIQMFI